MKTTLLATCCMSLLIVGNAQAVTLYNVTNLGTLGGSTSNALRINNGGQVVGYAMIPGDQYYHAFLWTAGGTGGPSTNPQMKDLGVVTGDLASKGQAINDAGVVAGDSYPAAPFNEHAFIYDGTQITSLGALGGARSGGRGIANNGQIVGWATVTGETAQRPFLWTPGGTDGSPSNPQMKDLGTLAGIGLGAGAGHDINNAGQVVGFATGSDSNNYPFLWTPGGSDGVSSNPQMRNLGTSTGGGQAMSLNDQGQVVGQVAHYSGANQHAFLWTRGATDGVAWNPELKDLGTLGGLTSAALGINSTGLVVGWSDTTQGNGHAFVYDGSRTMDLNTLITPGSGWVLTDARDINDSGQIVGTGVFNGQSAAVLLTPVGGDVIPTLFSTGISDSGAPLADLAVDPHYTLISVPSGSGLGANSYVVDSSKFPLSTGSWLANSSTSKWIAPQANQSVFPNDTGSGYYTYRTTFDLTGYDPSSAIITGQWAADNQGMDILINGMSTGLVSGWDFGQYLTSFTIDSGFVSGINTLDFVVWNGPLSGSPGLINPTGLRVEMVGTANPVPEPSSMCVLVGLLGMGLCGRWGQKRT